MSHHNLRAKTPLTTLEEKGHCAVPRVRTQGLSKKTPYTEHEVKKWYKIHQDSVTYQSDTSTHTAMLENITRLFAACPRLDNIIITDALYTNMRDLPKKQQQTFKSALPYIDLYTPVTPRYSRDNSRFALQQIIQSVERSSRSLSSLAIMHALLSSSIDAGGEPTLKHLKHLQVVLGQEHVYSYLASMLGGGRSLETLNIHGYEHYRLNDGLEDLLRAVLSGHLQSFELHGCSVSEPVLQSSLLRHAGHLKRL